jgi:dTMP kinase
MGLFIVFEGIEGCGKTTQISLAGKFLNEHNIPCMVTREPGGTPIGDEIRKILLSAKNSDILPLTELLLYTASKVQHLHQIIQPAMNNGIIVLCDRFFDATMAYQGYGEGLPLVLLEKVRSLALSGLAPDLTILLDCAADLGLNRSLSRIRTEGKEQAEGRFEAKELAFHERVREGYLQLAHREPQRFQIIDGGLPVEDAQQKICSCLTEKLREKGYVI